MQSVAPNDASTLRSRRTQQERRDGTQKLLLDATLSSLCELGYAATTTLEVERRAGVSRGARIHHFPTKAALLASAVDHLYTQISEQYERGFGVSVPGQSDLERFRHGLRMLWSIYKQPSYAAVLELQMAARTDAELREQLRAIAERHRGLAMAAALQFFPMVDSERARELIEVLHTSLLGLLMQRALHEGDLVADMVLAKLDDLFELHLGTATSAR